MPSSPPLGNGTARTHKDLETDMSFFPDGFIWGTATAAHQVEGGNWNNDWWVWEHTPGTGCSEPSGDACDHYHRYPTDIAMLGDLGFGAYRFSLEWSRIEPEEGEFSRSALDHYRRMCAACHEAGMVPMVTFHHFTTPRWVADRGGWSDPATADRFARFCSTAAEHLGDVIGWAATLNEPNVVAMMGYQAGVFPPGRRDTEMRRAVTRVLLDAHAKGADAIRSGPGRAPVGLTLSMSDFQAVDGGEEKRDRYRRAGEDPWLEAARKDDFLGVQTYSRTLVGPDGGRPAPEGAETTQMGYEFYPESLAGTLRRASEVVGPNVPLFVTENGIGTADDNRRIAYVQRALEGVRDCLTEGIDIRGYVYWSAMDNFEWAFGYRPQFGLIAVDRTTQERTPKPSAAWLGAVAKANALLPVPSA
jgi:beta-glucosidase